MKRRKLYDDVLTCVRNIERQGCAVALAGTYQIETGNMAIPEATAALLGFFPKLTDPAAISDGRCLRQLGWTGRPNGPSSVVTTASIKSKPTEPAGVWSGATMMASEAGRHPRLMPEAMRKLSLELLNRGVA